VPPFAGELHRDIVQLHSREYRRPSQLRGGGVLVAGVGNSGAEIALELKRSGRPVWLSGRDTGQIPFRIEGFLARHLLQRLVLRFVFHRLLTVRTPLGRKARAGTVGKGAPLIRHKPEDLAAAGVERVPRVVGVRNGRPLLEDGRGLDVENVVWCTGFAPDLSFLELPAAFGPDGRPAHERGVAAAVPGLYFVGLPFLYAFSSTMVHGVGRDAEYVARTLDRRVCEAATREERLARSSFGVRRVSARRSARGADARS